MREGSRLLRRPCLHSRAASAPHATPISLPGRQRLPRRLRASPLSARIQHPPALRPHAFNPALPLRALIEIFLESFGPKDLNRSPLRNILRHAPRRLNPSPSTVPRVSPPTLFSSPYPRPETPGPTHSRPR